MIKEGICNLKAILGEIQIVQKLNVNIFFFLLVAIYILRDCSKSCLRKPVRLLKKLPTDCLIHLFDIFFSNSIFKSP